jgi:hypothetical protein
MVAKKYQNPKEDLMKLGENISKGLKAQTLKHRKALALMVAVYLLLLVFLGWMAR